MSYATIEVQGNLGADPETKYTPSGAMVVECRIAVNNWRKPEDPPVWYRVSFWDRLAERMDGLAQSGKLQKGYSILVEGYYEPSTYTGNDGQLRVSHDVRAFRFDFTGGGRSNDNPPQEEPNF